MSNLKVLCGGVPNEPSFLGKPEVIPPEVLDEYRKLPRPFPASIKLPRGIVISPETPPKRLLLALKTCGNAVDRKFEKLSQMMLLDDSPARQAYCDYLQQILRCYFPRCRLDLFGASVSGLGFKGSTLHAAVDFGLPYSQPDTSNQEDDGVGNDSPKLLDMYNDPTVAFTTLLSPRKQISYMKKILFRHVDTLDRNHCKLVLNEGPRPFFGLTDWHVKLKLNIFGVPDRFARVDAEVVKFLCSLDDRCKPFMATVLYWIQSNNFAKKNGYRAHAVCMMALFFLTREGVIPVTIAELASREKTPCIIEGFDCRFMRSTTTIPQSLNTTPLHTLFVDFLNFIMYFNFVDDLIDLRHARVVSRKLFDAPVGFDMSCIFCVQAPFRLSENITCHISEQTLGRLVVLAANTLHALGPNRYRLELAFYIKQGLVPEGVELGRTFSETRALALRALNTGITPTGITVNTKPVARKKCPKVEVLLCKQDLHPNGVQELIVHLEKILYGLSDAIFIRLMPEGKFQKDNSCPIHMEGEITSNTWDNRNAVSGQLGLSHTPGTFGWLREVSRIAAAKNPMPKKPFRIAFKVIAVCDEFRLYVFAIENPNALTSEDHKIAATRLALLFNAQTIVVLTGEVARPLACLPKRLPISGTPAPSASTSTNKHASSVAQDFKDPKLLSESLTKLPPYLRNALEYQAKKLQVDRGIEEPIRGCSRYPIDEDDVFNVALSIDTRAANKEITDVVANDLYDMSPVSVTSLTDVSAVREPAKLKSESLKDTEKEDLDSLLAAQAKALAAGIFPVEHSSHSQPLQSSHSEIHFSGETACTNYFLSQEQRPLTEEQYSTYGVSVPTRPDVITSDLMHTATTHFHSQVPAQVVSSFAPPSHSVSVPPLPIHNIPVPPSSVPQSMPYTLPQVPAISPVGSTPYPNPYLTHVHTPVPEYCHSVSGVPYVLPNENMEPLTPSVLPHTTPIFQMSVSSDEAAIIEARRIEQCRNVFSRSRSRSAERVRRSRSRSIRRNRRTTSRSPSSKVLRHRSLSRARSRRRRSRSRSRISPSNSGKDRRGRRTRSRSSSRKRTAARSPSFVTTDRRSRCASRDRRLSNRSRSRSRGRKRDVGNEKKGSVFDRLDMPFHETNPKPSVFSRLGLETEDTVPEKVSVFDRLGETQVDTVIDLVSPEYEISDASNISSDNQNMEAQTLTIENQEVGKIELSDIESSESSCSNNVIPICAFQARSNTHLDVSRKPVIRNIELTGLPGSDQAKVKNTPSFVTSKKSPLGVLGCESVNVHLQKKSSPRSTARRQRRRPVKNCALKTISTQQKLIPGNITKSEFSDFSNSASVLPKPSVSIPTDCLPLSLALTKPKAGKSNVTVLQKVKPATACKNINVKQAKNISPTVKAEGMSKSAELSVTQLNAADKQQSSNATITASKETVSIKPESTSLKQQTGTVNRNINSKSPKASNLAPKKAIGSTANSVQSVTPVLSTGVAKSNLHGTGSGVRSNMNNNSQKSRAKNKGQVSGAEVNKTRTNIQENNQTSSDPVVKGRVVCSNTNSQKNNPGTLSNQKTLAQQINGASLNQGKTCTVLKVAVSGTAAPKQAIVLKSNVAKQDVCDPKSTQNKTNILKNKVATSPASVKENASKVVAKTEANVKANSKTDQHALALKVSAPKKPTSNSVTVKSSTSKGVPSAANSSGIVRSKVSSEHNDDAKVAEASLNKNVVETSCAAQGDVIQDSSSKEALAKCDKTPSAKSANPKPVSERRKLHFDRKPKRNNFSARGRGMASFKPARFGSRHSFRRGNFQRHNICERNISPFERNVPFGNAGDQIFQEQFQNFTNVIREAVEEPVVDHFVNRCDYRENPHFNEPFREFSPRRFGDNSHVREVSPPALQPFLNAEPIEQEFDSRPEGFRRRIPSPNFYGRDDRQFFGRDDLHRRSPLVDAHDGPPSPYFHDNCDLRDRFFNRDHELSPPFDDHDRFRGTPPYECSENLERFPRFVESPPFRERSPFFDNHHPNDEAEFFEDRNRWRRERSRSPPVWQDGFPGRFENRRFSRPEVFHERRRR